MRIDRMDKLDKINFYAAMHSNLVKWWSFTMVEAKELKEDGDDPDDLFDQERDGYDADAMAEELLADALGGDIDLPDPRRAFSEEAGMDQEAAAAAMEIFNRLQAEAAADEAKKLAEIEAAKEIAASNFG